MKSSKKRKILIIIVFVILLWANNTNLFTEKGSIKFLAHRGLAQNFDVSQVEWDTNTAAMIYEPEYDYIENTIPSIEAAFSYGADIVEIDLRLTKDEQLVVFHDYLLEYRTDGEGLVSEHTMSELRMLDAGYGYTADNGITYPLRGTGIGMIKEVSEILSYFEGKEFLIHIKDGGITSGEVFEEVLSNFDEDVLRHISVYGDKEALDYLSQQYPEMITLTKDNMIKGLVWYELIGWTGYIPKAIHNTEVHIPIEYAKYLWGYPNKLVERLDSVNSRLVLVKYEDGYSDGFDTVEDLDTIPDGYNGYIWTNRIDIATDWRNDN